MVVGVLVLASGALGVLIDLDHFLVARLRSGSWAALGGVVRDPLVAVTDQDAIFENGEVGKIPRLLSHVLLSGVLVGALALVEWRFALLAAVVLYVHLLSDLAADARELAGTGDL